MKHHLNKKHLAGALALLLGLLLLLHSCRKEHAVPTANVLASYKGSDKNVIKIIEELKKPENNTLLASLNQQGEVDWENYQAMLTSDFMQGLTLRFYQGPDSNYFDAQLNLETKDLRLLSKAQKRVEREQAIAQLMAESKTKGKSTMGYNNYRCKTPLNFEFVIRYGNSPLIESRFPYILSRFYFYLTQEMARYSFEYTSGRFIKYSVNGITTPQDYGNEIIIPIKSSFDYALNSINMEFRGFNYNNVFFGYVARIVSEGPTTCTTGDGGGGGDGTGPTTDPARDIRNKTTDPCISKTVEEVLAANKNIEGVMAEIIKNFDASKNVQINILDGITDNNAPGQVKFPTFEGNIFKANITLQTSYFKGPEAASKESLAAVLIHELTHAYIKSVNPDLLKSQHHNEIANYYIAPMTEYLHNKFGIKEEDAFALAWSGVPESEIFALANNETKFSYKVNNITKFSISKSEIYARAGAYNGNTNYQNEGIKGTQICN